MGRPSKNSADWFKHDADMRNDPKILYLRSEFGFEGYGVWCYLLEVLTDSEFFTTEWNDIRAMCFSGDFRLEKEKLEKIIQACLSLNLLQLDGTRLRCEKLEERMSLLVEKRGSRRIKFDKNGVSDIKNTLYVSKNGVSDVQNSLYVPESGVSDVQNSLYVPESGVSDVQNPQIRLDKIRLEQNRLEQIESNHKKTSLSLPDAPALADERERDFFDFLEIFFFKGYANPVAETEKFIAHYEGVGWLDSHGRKIQNKISIAKNWDQKKLPANECRPLPRIFLEIWKNVFERLKLVDPQHAGLALNIISVAITATDAVILVDQKTEQYFIAQKREIIASWELSTNLKFRLNVKSPRNETQTNPAATP